MVLGEILPITPSVTRTSRFSSRAAESPSKTRAFWKRVGTLGVSHNRAGGVNVKSAGKGLGIIGMPWPMRMRPPRRKICEIWKGV
jgi:hypothetical protein